MQIMRATKIGIWTVCPKLVPYKSLNSCELLIRVHTVTKIVSLWNSMRGTDFLN